MTTQPQQPQQIGDDTPISVRLSGGDWLKIAIFAVVQLIAAVIWLVKIEARVGNLETKNVTTEAAIKTLSDNGETLTRIDERTKEFDRRFERLERSISK